MKFEISRSFLMGLALAGLLTSCGGSNSLIDSPDDWAQAPVPGAESAPAKPQKAPKPAAKPPVKPAEAEAAAEPKKTSWWSQQKEKKDKAAAAAEVAKNAPNPPPAAPVKVADKDEEKESFWQKMGRDKKEEEKKEVAKKTPEKKVEAPRPEAAPVVKKNGKYPTAERSKFFSNNVLSPYDNRSINVSGIASGTLVADPRYPLDQKKYFIVP